ncbi:MAG: thioesterase family protein [Proteobacteria bacterium]|nr:thioesterase family protein [Pseudomonadota bacterium]
MQESDLLQILSRLQDSADNITSFDASWSQGRSAFGGIASAFVVTGMRKLLDSYQPMRSLMVSFIAPVPPGEVSVDARLQRKGKNVTQVSADLIADGAVCLQAMGVFGNPREALRVAPPKDFNPSPREQGIAFEAHAKRVPGFLQYFEGCWVDGGLPFSGRPSRHLNLWVRHKTNLENFTTEKLVTVADLPPPVILSYFDKPPVPASSLTWSLEFVVAPESIETEWFYLEFTVDAAADGYTQQSGRIFDETGRLCALSRQCMVYFG